MENKEETVKYDDRLDYWCTSCNTYLDESEVVFRKPVFAFKKEPHCKKHDIPLKVSGSE